MNVKEKAPKRLRFFVASLALVVLPAFFSSVYGRPIGLEGRVVDKSGGPIQGALARLIGADKLGTTDGSGRFFIDVTSLSILPSNPSSTFVSFHDGVLTFYASENQQEVQIELFDQKGLQVSRIAKAGAGGGTHALRLLPSHAAAAVYYIRLRIGGTSSVYKVADVTNRNGSPPAHESGPASPLGKPSANPGDVVDVLEISKDGYVTLRIDILNYATDLGDIVLEKDTQNEFKLPPIQNGKSAETTRYWDCCKPHCAGKANMRMCREDGVSEVNNRDAKSGCAGGDAFQCYDYAPIEISANVSYGWAAFNNSGSNCGDCYQLDFGDSLVGKQMIVQKINIGDGGSDSFDLLIPGGGVGALNGCSRQWNDADLGVRYGGFQGSCGWNEATPECVRSMCLAAFGHIEDLMRGCDWYIDWFGMTENPKVTYMKVPCPQEIKAISGFGN